MCPLLFTGGYSVAPDDGSHALSAVYKLPLQRSFHRQSREAGVPSSRRWRNGALSTSSDIVRRLQRSAPTATHSTINSAV